MKDRIISIIIEYVNNSDDGKFDFIGGKSGYEQPLFGFASINDPIFAEYKNIIDERHLTPGEAFENKFGLRLSNGTVLSIALPLNEELIKSNRKENKLPSVKWTLARTFIDDVFYKKIVAFLIKTLNDFGFRAVAPYSEDDFKVFPETNFTSTWSERHIAYAAGLGTFSINDAMITEKGIAVKFISVVTDLVIEPTERTAKNHRANCLFYSTGKCGICMKRCPASAITEQGHDKLKCYQFCYGAESKQLALSRGAYEKNGSGCGLCMSDVPCEKKNPMKDF
jgi:epoxyqueuosine reductase QueG